jgi:hypothetical protein
MAVPPKPVSLQGTAPTIFTGDRSLSETFMRDFKIYKIMNPLADVMKQPYARVATALSLIHGPKVDDWVDEQLKDLELKVHTTLRSNETLWTDFETAFADAFTDTVTIPRIRAGRPDHPGQATQTKTRSTARTAI